MTNTQFAQLMNMLEWIHTDLQAIRRSCERADARMAPPAPADVTPENAARVLLEADPFDAVAEALETVGTPGTGVSRHKRTKKGGRK